ncbi:VVA0879 family protein [Nostoc sp. MG11]|uniref:VVA0879 family protein n=1 Tax=Nostoc sp. MG11 TaxID=2721166 RepID=UPI0018688EC6|nr:VVA0879 family protein [Nostoc sp. MG11]
MTRNEWLAQGQKLFGKDKMQWKFKCPCCGHIATVQDYKKAGAPSSAVGFSCLEKFRSAEAAALTFRCVGRWLEVRKEAFDNKDKRKIPCNYAGGGLINLNPVDIDGCKVFEFGV